MKNNVLNHPTMDMLEIVTEYILELKKTRPVSEFCTQAGVNSSNIVRYLKWVEDGRPLEEEEDGKKKGRKGLNAATVSKLFDNLNFVVLTPDKAKEYEAILKEREESVGKIYTRLNKVLNELGIGAIEKEMIYAAIENRTPIIGGNASHQSAVGS